MKKNILNFTFCLCLVWAIVIIFSYNKEVQAIILEGLNLFFNRVFVSLFPMFILNDLLIWSNIPIYIARKTKSLSFYVFFMSLISGSPSNAYMLKNLVNNNYLTIGEANYYLYFTYFSNPLFLVSMLSSLFTKDILVKIILCHYLSNIIIAILLKNKEPKHSNTPLKIVKKPLSNTLINSIKRSMDTLLMILGTIIFYMILNFIITKTLDSLIIKTLIGGFLEITNGLNMLKNISLALKLKEIIAGVFISFGGLSINTQIKALLEDSPISYKPFLKGRIYQALITMILLVIF